MKLLALPDTIAEKIERLLQPIVAANDSSQSRDDDCRVKWRKILEEDIERWRAASKEIEEEGLDAPTSQVLESCSAIGEVLRDLGVEPPDTLVPNGDGGIVFRWRLNGRSWSIELAPDGTFEARLVQHGRLVWRHCLHEISTESR